MTVAPLKHTFTVDEYHRMGEAGILNEDDRVELIEGEIVDMAPVGDRHISAVDRLNELFTLALAGRAIIRTQGSVRLNDQNEPQPDIVVLRRRDDFYARNSAGPGDTFLIIEVADSSLTWYRDVKAPLYAGTGIPEFWLVDVEARSITVFREPGPTGYGVVLTAEGGDVVSPLAFPDFVTTPQDVIL
jgi:Uma2 family endonuclease